MIVSLLLLCIFILSLCHYIIHYGKYGRSINRIPGDSMIPLLGNMLQWCNRSNEELWTYQRKLGKIFYPLFKIWHVNIAYVSVQHPDDLETIMSNTKAHIGKGYMYTFLNPWLETGLLTSDGAKWHQRRKLLTPGFHFNMLKQFVDVLIEEGYYMAQCAKDIEGSVINDLVSLVSHHTLNAICETAMGTSLKDMGEFQEQYRNAIHDMGKFLAYRIMRPWFHPDATFALTPIGRKQAKSLKILHGFTNKIIAEKKEYHKSTNGQYLKQFDNNSVTDDDVIGVRKKRLAMLDLLIAASHETGLDDLGIREEVDTFMFEGHDTVAMGITFAILLLAEHKDIQDRVRDEVNAVMQENGGKITMSALNNMLYLERCIKESLRLYPSVPFIGRVLSEDTKLQSYTVPAGTLLHITIYDTHRDPNFWPNPEEFDPDRFLPERVKSRHPFSYLPFSAGSRNCIGQRFAMLELKAIIAPLVHNFYLEPIDHLKDIRFMLDVILRATRPIRVKFVPIVRTESH